MGIRRFVLTVTTALITLAVPGTVLAQGAAAATNGRSMHAASTQNANLARVQDSSAVMVLHQQASLNGDGSRDLHAGLDGCGGFNGTLTWTNTTLKLTGVAYGQSGIADISPNGAGDINEPLVNWTCTAYVYLNWKTSNGVKINRDVGHSNGKSSATINYYTGTPGPSGAVVSDCGYAYGGTWKCGPPA